MNILISNLPSSITEQDIKELFVPYGETQSVALIKDKDTGVPTGSAYVMMDSDVEGDQALAGLEGMEYKGQNLYVIQADAADFPSGEYW